MLAYFDCFSGISGDMTLGALLDLGVPLEWLNKKLNAIPLDGFRGEEENNIVAAEIRSIRFEFDHEKNGTVVLDQIGFTQ